MQKTAGVLWILSLWITLVSCGQRQGTENELFQERSASTIITSSWRSDINTTPALEAEIEINNSDGEMGNVTTTTTTAAAITTTAATDKSAPDEMFAEYNEEETTATSDVYDFSEWTTAVPQEDAIDVKDIFDTTFSGRSSQEPEITRGITILQDWLKESQSIHTTTISGNTLPVVTELAISNDQMEDLVDKVEDELVELEVLREDQLKEQQEIEKTVDNIQENLQIIFDIKNRNDSPASETEESATIKAANNLDSNENDKKLKNEEKNVNTDPATEGTTETITIQTTAKALTTLVDTISPDTKTTKRDDEFTDSTTPLSVTPKEESNISVSGSTLAVDAENKEAAETVEEKIIQEDTLEEQPKENIPTTNDEMPKTTRPIEMTTTEIVTTQSGAHNSKVNKEDQKPSAASTETIAPSVTGQSTSDKISHSLPNSATHDAENTEKTDNYIPTTKVINTTESSVAQSESESVENPKWSDETEESAEEVLIVPKIKVENNQDLTLVLTPAKEVSEEKPSEDVETTTANEVLDKISKIADKVIGDIIEDVREVILEEDAEKLNTDLEDINDKSLEKLAEESKKMQEIIDEMVEHKKDVQLISSNGLNSEDNFEDINAEKIEEDITEEEEDDVQERKSAEGKSLKWHEDESVEALEEPDGESMTTLSGTVFHDSGNVCINASKIAIKVTLNDTSFWLPSNCFMSGNCNKSGSYLKFVWTHDKLSANMTLSLAREQDRTMLTQITLNLNKEGTLRAQGLSISLSDDPVTIDLPESAVMQIVNPSIRLYDEETVASGTMLTANNALALQIASGALCMLCILISLGIFTYRKIRTKTRIFKVSVDK